MDSTSDLASSKSRVPLWVLSLAMFPLGLGGFILMTGDLIQGIRSRQWETVQGTVLSSHLSPGFFGLKQPIVRYSYRINGAAHVSNRVWPGSIVGNLPVANPRLANKLIATFQGGAVVPVYVNPSNSDQSALEPGPKRAVLWTALFSFFIVIGLWSPLALGRWLKH